MVIGETEAHNDRKATRVTEMTSEMVKAKYCSVRSTLKCERTISTFQVQNKMLSQLKYMRRGELVEF